YGFNRAGGKALEGVIENWWRQGMMGGAKAHYDSIKAFSETDFNEDLKSIDVPTLVMHGDDDQIVPYKDAALLSVNLLKNGTLKIYPAFPHGMLTTHADVINQDLLPFVRSQHPAQPHSGVVVYRPVRFGDGTRRLFKNEVSQGGYACLSVISMLCHDAASASAARLPLVLSEPVAG